MTLHSIEYELSYARRKMLGIIVQPGDELHFHRRWYALRCTAIDVTQSFQVAIKLESLIYERGG